MNPLVFGTVLIGAGVFSGAHIITGVGVLAILAGLIKRTPSKEQTAPLARPLKHKLVDAQYTVWDDEPWFPYLAMTQSLMGGVGQVDPIGSAFNNAGLSNRHAHDAVRNMLPFSQYGRNSALESIFVGLPLSMGAFLHPKR